MRLRARTMGFQRLAYHRSWFLVGLGLVGLAPLGATIVVRTWRGTWFADDPLPYLVGLAIATLIVARGLTGSWSTRQLRVDVPAGKLQLADGSVRNLDELGGLSIENQLGTNETVRPQYRPTWYRLRAGSLDRPLFSSPLESETKLRAERLDAAVLQHRVRRVLEGPQLAGGAFRERPEPLGEIMRIAGSAERALAALRGLARDPDRDVRQRAAGLVANVQRGESSTSAGSSSG